MSLREIHKHSYTNKNQSFIQVKDVALVYSDKTPKSMWRMEYEKDLQNEQWQKYWTPIFGGDWGNCRTRAAVLSH